MTSDKQNNGSLAKPFTPTLSAAFNRSTKSPLTPKLATAAVPRAAKRLAPPDPPSTPDPDAPFLNVNVTPRSGPRITRRDVLTSPNNTPSTIQYSPHTPFSQSSYRTDRSPVRGNGKLEPSRVNRAKLLTTENPSLSRPSSFSDLSSGSRMFFHAHEARPTISSDLDVRPKPQGKPSSPAAFIYANGEEERQSAVEETNTTLSLAKRPSTSLPRSVVSVKFPASCSPRLKSAKLSDSSGRLSDGIGSQVGSQTDGSSELSSQIHSPLISNLPARPPVPAAWHIKSSSIDSAPPREGLQPSPIIISPADSHIDTSDAPDPMPELRLRIVSDGSMTSIDTYASSEPQNPSPVKSESTVQGNNDAALNARIERKILDLEISNSSLLAINRTLEREMRKQNAELRRYRRLSRSGRLSMAPSTRSFSGSSLPVTSELDEGISELSSIRSPEHSDFSDEESMLDESVLSPDSLAENDARHSAHDEKRFFVDLSKHQELLADSQKLNQSLKRCLDWTEELIKDGKKALEYSVHVADVELGGRVLAPEELHEEGEGGRGLLSLVGSSPDLELATEKFDVDTPDFETYDSETPDIEMSDVDTLDDGTPEAETG